MKEASSAQESPPSHPKQESAQTTSSHVVKRERANLQASERSNTKVQTDIGNIGSLGKIQQSKTPFSQFGDSDEGGRMETKVSNGIETEEV